MTQSSQPKLRDLPADERAAALHLPAADIAALRTGLTLDQADHMIENAIATYALPMGVATSFSSKPATSRSASKRPVAVGVSVMPVPARAGNELLRA